MIGKRVYDNVGDDYGTVVDVDGRGRCLIEWDRQPPNQPPYVKVPSHWVSFVAEAPRPAQSDGPEEAT
jgi:hypothetical protein